jgi:uncharacterized protein
MFFSFFSRVIFLLALSFSVVLHPLPSLCQPPLQEKICYWEVEKDGKKSTLLGTMHILSGDYLKDLKSSITSSEVIIIEVADFSHMYTTIAQTVMLAPGQRLEEVISPELLKKVREFFEKKSLPEEFITRCKPWYLGMLAQLLQTENLLPLKGLPMDLYILKLAQAKKIKTVGIETLEQQMGYFDELPLKDQETFLSLAISDETRKELEDLKNLYLQAEDGKIAENMMKSVKEPQTHGIYQKIYIDRNHLMNKTVLPYVEKGNAFIAVGFAHMVSETGMVRFLEQKGFRVSKKHLTR